MVAWEETRPRRPSRIKTFADRVRWLGPVGRFPEDTVSWMHVLGAGLAIGVGSLAIFVLGLVLPLPDWLRWPMRIVAPIALVALVLFASHHDLGIGEGTMERIAAYPETIWLISFGVY